MAAEQGFHLCTWTLTLHINPNGTHPLWSVVPFRLFSPRCWRVRKKKKPSSLRRRGVSSLASGQNRDERACVRSLLTCKVVLPYLRKESLLGIHYQSPYLTSSHESKVGQISLFTLFACTNAHVDNANYSAVARSNLGFRPLQVVHWSHLRCVLVSWSEFKFWSKSPFEEQTLTWTHTVQELNQAAYIVGL